MKGKITIVLLGLALAFGMVAASCTTALTPHRMLRKKAPFLLMRVRIIKHQMCP